MDAHAVDVTALTAPDRLGPALAGATADERWISHRSRLVSGGKSNLTFEVVSEAGTLILRRPPSGKLLPSAHDMRRETRVQRALRGSAVPVPRIVLVDETGDLTGFPYYVMEKVDGPVIRDRLPESYAVTPAERVGMADRLVDTLVGLHSIDAGAAGLSDFGRPEGYLERQLSRWWGQWESSADREVPEVTVLAERLATRLPVHRRSAILHGDFRLENCVMDPADPSRIAAVLDWEMSTRGDPLTDVGLFLFYWREPGDPPLALVPTVTDQPGFPSRQYLAERYATATGVDLSDMDFYLAFANFKFAVIVQGILARVSGGAMAGQDFGDLAPLVVGCVRAGIDLLGNKS